MDQDKEDSSNLFFSEHWTDAHDIDNISLHNTIVGKVPPTHVIELLALSLPLLLLLSQTLMAVAMD